MNFTAVVPPTPPLPPPPGAGTLPPGWKEMNGPTGKYYYNEHTLETTWTPPGSSVPDTPLPMPLPPAPQGNGASGPALPPPRVSVHGNRKSLGGRYSARYGAHAHPIMPQSNNPAAYTYGAGSVGN